MTKRQNTHTSETEKVYDVIFKPKQLQFFKRTFHKIVYAHTKFGLLWVKGSGVKRGGGAVSVPPGLSEFLKSLKVSFRTPNDSRYFKFAVRCHK